MFNQIFNHNKTDEFFFRRDALCYVCYFSLQSIVFEIHEQCRKSTMDNRYQMCFCVAYVRFYVHKHFHAWLFNF